MAALLEIKDLEISFRQGRSWAPAAEGVSFSVQAGEFVAIVGESGSGKSITALSVLGLLPRQGKVTGGQILLDGADLAAMPEEKLDLVRGRDIAMIFQDIMYSLNPVISIGSQLCEGMRRHLGYDRDQARQEGIRLLRRTGIPDAEQVMKKYPHMLSGGMRQRVMIAMALSCRPRLLIADEPTTALDVTIQYQIMQLLSSLRKETGMSILLITHDIGLVAETADRVVVMYAGQCVEEADVRTLLSHPAHAYTRALMRSVPGLHDDRGRELYSIPGHVPEEYDRMTGCRFAPRCEYEKECAFKADDTMVRVAPMHFSRCRFAGGGGPL